MHWRGRVGDGSSQNESIDSEDIKSTLILLSRVGGLSTIAGKPAREVGVVVDQPFKKILKENFAFIYCVFRGYQLLSV